MAGQWSEQEASAWLESDNFQQVLALPRRIAATIISDDMGTVNRVADIASGPGTFLGVLLDRFAECSGVWHDASETMRQDAQKNLQSYGDRVTFVVGDMLDIGAGKLSDDLDVIVTSRAAHHLSPSELASFYHQAFGRLRVGGWMVNLDHVLMEDPWETRLRSVRNSMLRRAADGESSHRHDKPLPTLEHHLEGLRAAGAKEIGIAWQAFYSYLIMAKKSL